MVAAASKPIPMVTEPHDHEVVKSPGARRDMSTRKIKENEVEPAHTPHIEIRQEQDVRQLMCFLKVCEYRKCKDQRKKVTKGPQLSELTATRMHREIDGTYLSSMELRTTLDLE